MVPRRTADAREPASPRRCKPAPCPPRCSVTIPRASCADMRLVTSHRRRSVAAARLRRRTLATSPLVRHSLGAKPASRSAGTTLAAVIGTVLLVVALLVTGVVGAAGFVTVASITVLSEDLPDPSGLATLTFDQPTIVYDRTGKVELA